MSYGLHYKLKTDTLGQGLVARYKFNGNANDSSGNGYHGTVNGATLTTNRFGMANSAYSFDGVDDYIQLSKEVLNRGSSDFTINAWIRSSDYSKRNTIITSYDSYTNTQANMGLVLEAGSYYTWMYLKNTVGNEFYVRYYEPLINNNIYMITGIRKANILSLFINCKFIKSISVFGNVNITTGYNYIGKINDVRANGIIDDIRIYNRALSTSEIKALYRQTLLATI